MGRKQVFCSLWAAMILGIGVHCTAMAQAKVQDKGFSHLQAEPKQLAQIGPRSSGVDVSRAGQIRQGQSQASVLQQLGEPFAKTSIDQNEGWEYQLSLPLQDGRSIIVCQFMVVYDSNASVQDTYWRRPQCASKAQQAFNGDRFGFNESTLSPALIDQLQHVVLAARQQPQPYRMTVVGYTDRLGNATYNQKLSERRAQNAARYLAGQGIPRQFITYEGRGEADPLVACNNALPRAELIECLAPNRRVAVQIQPA